MFGMTFPKLAIIGIIAVVIIGPERLPQLAARLAALVKTVRSFTDTAKERVREEMGPDFDDIDWKKLDPRQYDPRRIIREALLDDPDEDHDAPMVRMARKVPVETADPVEDPADPEPEPVEHIDLPKPKTDNNKDPKSDNEDSEAA